MNEKVSPAAPSLPENLPPLREDLQLHPSAPHADGSHGWTIQDPVSNAFYRIGWLEFELLARWHLGTPAALLAAASAETPLAPSEEELLALYQFLLGHQLLSIHDPRYTRGLIERFQRSRLGRAKWLLHHYLFFRIPLVHPAQRLQALLPWLAWIFTRSTAGVVLLLGTLGLILTARQWDVFVASFLDTLSPGGLVGYLLALAVAKSLHELGHALTATRYGLRVSHMGVAFLVMWPMLYTDTGESWRLADRHQRLKIASAGIITELALAALATLAWNLTDEGNLRQAFFFLASTAWLISLTLNASPFMRFDGYFILSDALDLHNLHERSFALARVALRNTLLGWHEPDPEVFSPSRRRALIGFALAVWIYRLIVFVGIAIAVYVYFFKLLGIFLFAVEIAWFVLLPLWRELKIWQARRHEISRYRQRVALCIAAAGLLLALIPWSYQITAPAWAHPEKTHVFYTPTPARLLTRPTGPLNVAAGDTVFLLEQPEQIYRARIAQASASALDSQLKGLLALPDGEERRASLSNQQAMRGAELTAQTDETDRLRLQAPFSGTLVDIDPEIAPGTWIGPRQPLAALIAPASWIVEALISQKDLARVAKGDKVRFYPEQQPLTALSGRVFDIETTRSQQLPHPMLSSQHGGPVPVLVERTGLTPRDTLYRIRIHLDTPPEQLATLRGQVSIEGKAQSWLIEALKPVIVVLIREASF